MDRIHIEDVISLLNIPQPRSGNRTYNIPCPCCDDDPKKKHLNINLEKDVFRCPRCGFAGGALDLYAYFTGTNRRYVKKEIMRRLDMKEAEVGNYPPPQTSDKPNSTSRHSSGAVKVAATKEDYPLTDLDARHETYTALLDMLSLADDHRENLRNRGLTDDEIKSLGYKTTPYLGMPKMAKQLQEDGYYLPGVPGFYRNKDGAWTFVREQRGILIPVRSPDGKIQGIQVRRDHVAKRKFRWISSAGKADGCKAECWTHLAGPIQSTIILTEGPMKADIIHKLSGDTVLAVPGVHSLKHLSVTLEQLRDQGVVKIKTAFDMDFHYNPFVQRGYQALTELLANLDFCYSTYVWDSRYKGLDDYIWECCMNRER